MESEGTTTHIAKPVTDEHPLGPLVRRVSCTNPVRARLIALMVLAGCCALLGVAAHLTPDPAGMGTHQQLGYPPCTFVVVSGYPCPTCGMTTAFSLTVRGRFVAAFSAQPAGFAFAMATILIAGLALSAAVSGKVWELNWYRVSHRTPVLIVVGMLLVGWLYKIVAGLVTGTLPVG